MVISICKFNHELYIFARFYLFGKFLKMNKILPIAFAVISTFGLTACDNSLPEEARLNEIVSKTQTTEKARTVEWYQSNDFVRNDVLQTCMDIVERKVSELNAIGGDLKYDDIDKQVNKNQDCLNARQANINIEAELDKSRITYNEYNKRLNQYTKKSEDLVLTEEERNQAQAYMNDVMKDMDTNKVARQGEEQFEQLKKLAEQEVKAAQAESN